MQPYTLLKHLYNCFNIVIFIMDVGFHQGILKISEILGKCLFGSTCLLTNYNFHPHNNIIPVMEELILPDSVL